MHYSVVPETAQVSRRGLSGGLGWFQVPVQPVEASHLVGHEAATVGQNQVQSGKPVQHAAEQQRSHRYSGVVHVLDAHVEHRVAGARSRNRLSGVDEQGHAQLHGGRPKIVQGRLSQIDAVHAGGHHSSQRATLPNPVFQLGGRPVGILHGHRRQHG